MVPPNNPTPEPRTFAERAAARKPLTEEERAEIRDEMRRDADWTAALVAAHGYPFEGIEHWETELDDEPDAA